MSAARNPRLRKAVVLVPLAALSVAWTASVAGVGGPGPSPVAASPGATQAAPPAALLPDGATVPETAIEAPASVSEQASVAGAGGDAPQIVSTSSTSGIPSAALAAYQRAETVINAADATCQLPWQLVAAIGRVESDHGRFGGSVLDDAGVATPGIIGLPLDGTQGTALINDTDAGQYDADLVYDRAVGPMQFIPSTWSVVGVDADGDGVRNPQDIDDAALGSAVYLCSGDDDLSTEGGQRASVFRYNNSESYVDLVLSVMAAYTAGDFTSIPNSTVAAGRLVIAPPTTKTPAGSPGADGGTDTKTESTEKSPGVRTPSAPPTPTPTPTPTPAQEPKPPLPPGKQDGNQDGNQGGKGNGKPNGPGAAVPSLPTTSNPPVDALLSVPEATAQCTTDGFSVVTDPARFEQCVQDYTTP